MSLSRSHPIFTTCGSNPYEIKKAAIQAQFLSGKARVESLTKNWDKSNKDGICQLCKLVEHVPGTIDHILLAGGCPALAETRQVMLAHIQAYLVPRPYLFPVFESLWGKEDKTTMQFILDCSVIPTVIKLSQESENPILHDLFYLTRCYVYKLFVTRRRLLGLM